jgi:hypothetical protein
VLATGGTTIVGVVIGASLTYLFGALNRRHQEAREKETRWYEKRLQAYTELSAVAFDGLVLSLQSIEQPSFKEHEANAKMLAKAVASIRLVGSPEVVKRANEVMDITLTQLQKRGEPRRGTYWKILDAFEASARKDLGH